jgi:ssDNA thymidine ADP-ribosyltransferase, DarT
MAGAGGVNEIRAAAAARGVTRLCHLTPFRNLLHIADGDGIMSVAQLTLDERLVFSQQDQERYDNHPDHISCSVQYPNVWYLRRKRQALTKEQLFFPDWVCLFIDPAQLDRPGVKFCVRNAGYAGGTMLEPGLAAFESMFADQVYGANGLAGRERRPRFCTTDDQAEVMLPRFVPLGVCSHVAVSDEAQAKRVYGSLDLLGVPVHNLRWTIAPDLFLPRGSSMLRSGRLPQEAQWGMDS